MSETVEKAPLILVCDDDADARSLIVSTVSVLGYETVEAIDGQEAMEVCRKTLPDLILLDIMMPRVTGIEFLAWFREAIPEPFVPVLLITALDQIESRVEGFAKGADDYLTKPFHWKELQARIQALLRIRDLTVRLREHAKRLEATNQELQATQAKLLENERQVAVAQVVGAAAHNLGQPIQSMLLNIFLLEKYFAQEVAARETLESQAGESVRSLSEQCHTLRQALQQLQQARGEEVADYAGGLKILDLKKNS